MNTRAQARFRRLLAATLPLLLAPVPALLAQSAAVLETSGDVRALLRSAQAAALPARASSSIAEERSFSSNATKSVLSQRTWPNDPNPVSTMPVCQKNQTRSGWKMNQGEMQ